MAWFTVVWTFVNVFFHFTVGLILALVLNRTLRLRGMYRLLLLIPWAVPSFISAFTFRFLFNSPYGFFAQVLQKLGMDQEQVPAFLSDPFWAKVVVITANVWAGIPFMMVALLGGLQSIDQDLSTPPPSTAPTRGSASGTSRCRGSVPSPPRWSCSG